MIRRPSTEAEVSIVQLREALAYDPETGRLTWKVRPPHHFSTPAICNRWNAKYAGREAFTTLRCGYRIGDFNGKRLSAQRACWAIHYGEWPKGQIDHLDGQRDHNAILNMRDVSHQENGKNQKIKRNNKTGVSGVRFTKGRWQAEIRVNGKLHYLGRFPSFEEAKAARQKAEVLHGFHPNHGRAA